MRQQRRKTWADRQGIKTGVWGEYIYGIRICEENRATGWEFRPEGISVLMKICTENYRKKGVNAVVFGIDEDGKSAIRYAVFVKNGFLIPVSDED